MPAKKPKSKFSKLRKEVRGMAKFGFSAEERRSIIFAEGIDKYIQQEKIGEILARGLRKLVGKNQRIKAHTVRWLGILKDKRAVPVLIEVLKDKEGRVRQEAAFALGEIRDKRAVPGLIGTLKDKKWEIRGSAALALGELGDKKAVPALKEALKDKDSDVRQNARAALKKIRAKKR